MSQLKAAVIGVGSHGRHHVRVYGEMDQVELVAISDMNEEVLDRVGVNRWSTLPTYTDYRLMLEREKPDIVSIAVPTKHHCEVALEVVNRGVHVLVEKPIALTLEEARRMIQLAAQQGVKLAIGHIERFNPAVTEARRRLEAQELGSVFQVHARRLSPFPKRITDISVILDLATHDLDVMRYLVGGEVERVYAETGRRLHGSCDDLLSGLLRFSNGTIGVLDVNWLTPTKVRRLQILGETGMYLIDYLTQDLYWYQNGDIQDDWETMALLRGISEGDMIKVHIPRKEPLRVELESFADAVLHDRQPLVTGHDGLVVLDLALRLTQSANTHVPITVEREAVTLC